ncbi:hypothetical protein [Kitasatospora sp. KL5]|uniref:hypothetical protein n=1 Tax=Kitasatospora sp. KL5 TaxID=3425125 RepID=UPI003D6F71C5
MAAAHKPGTAAQSAVRGQAPTPIGHPEPAANPASVPDTLAETSGDLLAVVRNAAVNARRARHIQPGVRRSL